jgi:transposase
MKRIDPAMYKDMLRARDAKRRLIANAYELGTPIKDIAKEFGCSLGTVNYTAKVMGLPKRFGGPSWNRPALRWTSEPIQLLTLRTTEGWPLETIRRELSHKFGVVFTRAAVEKKAKQLGLKTARRRNNSPRANG